MKSLKILTLAATSLTLLFLVGVGSYAGPMKDSVEGKQDFRHMADDMVRVFNSNAENNRCQDAEVITGEAVTDVQWEYTEESIIFPNGTNVDDWFAYTTVADNCPPDTTQVNFGVGITSDDIDRLAVAVYEDCGSWPVVKGETAWGNEDELACVITDVDPGVTYYIHVNLIDAPESGNVIYDLRVGEHCFIPPF
jgi:hypothetical protein